MTSLCLLCLYDHWILNPKYPYHCILWIFKWTIASRLWGICHLVAAVYSFRDYARKKRLHSFNTLLQLILVFTPGDFWKMVRLSTKITSFSDSWTFVSIWEITTTVSACRTFVSLSIVVYSVVCWSSVFLCHLQI